VHTCFSCRKSRPSCQVDMVLSLSHRPARQSWRPCAQASVGPPRQAQLQCHLRQRRHSLQCKKRCPLPRPLSRTVARHLSRGECKLLGPRPTEWVAGELNTCLICLTYKLLLNPAPAGCWLTRLKTSNGYESASKFRPWLKRRTKNAQRHRQLSCYVEAANG
jgi:hypothetical protein